MRTMLQKWRDESLEIASKRRGDRCRCVVGLTLAASMAALLSGCFTVRAHGGTQLVVQGRVLDGATD